MYKGKEPVYVVISLVLALAFLGFFMTYLMNDHVSALKGSTVIQPLEDDVPLDTQASVPVDTGSAVAPFDLNDRTFRDFALGEDITVDGYFIKVVSIKALEKVGTYLTPTTFQGTDADKLFYVVQMQITSLSAKEQYAPLDMFVLSDGISTYSIDEEATKFFGAESIQYPVLRKDVRRIVKFAFDVDPGMYDLYIFGNNVIYRVKITS